MVPQKINQSQWKNQVLNAAASQSAVDSSSLNTVSDRFFFHFLGNQGLDYICLLNKKTNYVKDIIIIMGVSSNLD